MRIYNGLTHWKSEHHTKTDQQALGAQHQYWSIFFCQIIEPEPDQAVRSVNLQE